jgi:hypothetical protein
MFLPPLPSPSPQQGVVRDKQCEVSRKCSRFSLPLSAQVQLAYLGLVGVALWAYFLAHQAQRELQRFENKVILAPWGLGPRGKGDGAPLNGDGFTREAILLMNSAYSIVADWADVTVLVDIRSSSGISSLARQLDAVLRQSSLPMGGVWVCSLGGDSIAMEAEVNRIVEDWRQAYQWKNVPLYVTHSEADSFAAYGRAQLALQATTKFVWCVGEAVVPGELFLSFLQFSAGTVELWGILGSEGVIASAPLHHSGHALLQEEEAVGGCVPQWTAKEVDALTGQWFAETDSLRLLFRDSPWDAEGAGESEGAWLSLSARKFASSPSWVLPVDSSDPRTWGHSSSNCLQNKRVHSSWGGGRILPDWSALVRSGGELILLRRSIEASILFIVDTAQDARLLAPAYKSAKGMVDLLISRPARVVMTGRAGCAEISEALGDSLDLCDPYGLPAFSLRLSAEADAPATEVMEQVAWGLTGVLRLIRAPAAIVTSALVGRGVLDAADVVSRGEGGVCHLRLAAEDAATAPWLGLLQMSGDLALPRAHFAVALMASAIQPDASAALVATMSSLSEAHTYGLIIDVIIIVSCMENVTGKSCSSLLDAADQHKWEHGSKSVFMASLAAPAPVGVQELALSMIWPTATQSAILILEVGMVVSPFLFAWMLIGFGYSAEEEEDKGASANFLCIPGVALDQQDPPSGSVRSFDVDMDVAALSRRLWLASKRACLEHGECAVRESTSNELCLTLQSKGMVQRPLLPAPHQNDPGLGLIATAEDFGVLVDLTIRRQH